MISVYNDGSVISMESLPSFLFVVPGHLEPGSTG